MCLTTPKSARLPPWPGALSPGSIPHRLHTRRFTNGEHLPTAPLRRVPDKQS